MLNQRVRRALHRPLDATCAQQPAHERRLAAAEFALQRHEHATLQVRREARADALGRRGVRKMEGQR